MLHKWVLLQYKGLGEMKNMVLAREANLANFFYNNFFTFLNITMFSILIQFIQYTEVIYLFLCINRSNLCAKNSIRYMCTKCSYMYINTFIKEKKSSLALFS